MEKRQKKHKVSGVLLDFDGVIVDSLNAHIDAWRLAFTELFQRSWPEDYSETIKHRSGAYISSFLSQEAERPLQAKNLFSLKEKDSKRRGLEGPDPSYPWIY